MCVVRGLAFALAFAQAALLIVLGHEHTRSTPHVVGYVLALAYTAGVPTRCYYAPTRCAAAAAAYHAAVVTALGVGAVGWAAATRALPRPPLSSSCLLVVEAAALEHEARDWAYVAAAFAVVVVARCVTEACVGWHAAASADEEARVGLTALVSGRRGQGAARTRARARGVALDEETTAAGDDDDDSDALRSVDLNE
jgi:hypothetical protein